MIMNTLPSFAPGEHARIVRDRVDRLLIGHALAARHRVLRLGNGRAAMAFRAAAYAGAITEADFPPPAPTARSQRARATVAKLLG
jgi:hypothetical protein